MIRLPIFHSRDALFLARCFYLAPLLILWPIKSPLFLAGHGSNHFHPPLGPFLLFSGYPSAEWVRLFEGALFLLFAFWLAGRGGWKVGGAISLILTLLSGFVYCTGKVDHDFIILLAPLLLTLPKSRDSLAVIIAIYYASSGFAKAAGYWLDPASQASLSWALYYRDVHQPPALLLDWALHSFPGWFWEVCDLATVGFELAVPLAIIPRFRKFILPAIPLFHIGVLLLFGIDFSRLLLLYRPLAILVSAKPDKLPLKSKTKKTIMVLFTCALLLSWTHRFLTGTFWKIELPTNSAGLTLFSLLALILSIHFFKTFLPKRKSAD